MSNIYEFPVENLRKEIRDGYASNNTKDLIRRVLLDLSVYNPNSWDRDFCEDILTNSKRISDKQAVQLERILDDILAKTEHPSFTPKLIFPESKPEKNDT